MKGWLLYNKEIVIYRNFKLDNFEFLISKQD